MAGTEIMPLKMAQGIGHFGMLTHCTLLAKACTERSVEPFFFVSNDLWQTPGLASNAFSYYYDHRRLSHDQQEEATARVIDGDCVVIADRHDVNRFAGREIMNDLRTLGEGRRLFERFICIRPAIRRIANAFYDRALGGARVLGVHYRGHDKQRLETDPVPFGRIYEVVAPLMAGSHDKLFLATDDERFHDWMMGTDLAPSVVWRSTAWRRGPHFLDRSDNFRKGADALIDAMLLARCGVVVKTPSLLSAWSKVFEPRLKLILVGRPYKAAYGDVALHGYGYWPERCFYDHTPWTLGQRISRRIRER